MKEHPIQLEYLGVKELHVRSFVPPAKDLEIESNDMTVSIGHGDYDEERKILCVSMGVQLGKDDVDCGLPLFLKVEVTGVFKVDDNRFDIKNIEDFAENNAPYILNPYIREHVFALSARCGFRPIIMPLIEVPTRKPKLKASRRAAPAKAKK